MSGGTGTDPVGEGTRELPARIHVVAPSLTNAHGDAENADVLVQRLRWRGIAGELVRVESADSWHEPAAIVIGSATDPAAAELRDLLAVLAPKFREALDTGVPILAVGTAWELLSDGLAGGGEVDALPGLGLVAGQSVSRPTRIADDLIARDGEHTLVGFENHARDVALPAGAQPLGRIVRGHGNGDGTEGLVQGSFIATRMHGPVLARNPWLADRMLAALLAPGALPIADAHTKFADDLAANSRARTLAALELGEQSAEE